MSEPAGWEAWRDAFSQVMVELGVTSTDTEMYLAKAYVRCATEGLGPEQVFGPAKEYAHSLPRTAASTRRRWALLVARLASMSASVLTIAVTGPWRRPLGSQVTWEVGPILCLAILLVTLIIEATQPFRSGRDPWLLGSAALFPAIVVALTVHIPLFTTPMRSTMVIVGTTALVAAAVELMIRWQCLPVAPVSGRRQWFSLLSTLAIPTLFANWAFTAAFSG